MPKMPEVEDRMITALIGNNSYKIKKEKNLIVQSFQKKYGDLAVEFFNDESIASDIHDALNNLPFLVDKKLVVIENPSRLKDLTSNLTNWLAQSSDTIDVLITELNPDKRTAWYKFIIQKFEVINCDSLDEGGVRNWIVDYTKNNNSQIDSVAVNELIRRVGLDQNQIKNELDKLISYDTKIDLSSVKLLVDYLPRDTVFNLLDELIAGNTKKTMELYDSLVVSGVDPHEILAMLSWQLHTLLLVKTSLGSSSDSGSGLHPFVVRKNTSLARKLSLDEFDKIVGYIIQAELSIKRDGLNANNVVPILIHKMLSAIK